ncbi:hypothetical protein D9M71_733910 [compost metagenome]
MPLTSTVKPPLTLPLITPLTTSSALKAASRTSQDSARLAFSRDSLVSPKPSSTASSATWTSSPTLMVSSPCSLKNCSTGMTPSDFRPAWTVTQSPSMSTTMPVMMAPGCMSRDFRLSSKSSAKLSLMFIPVVKGQERPYSALQPMRSSHQ